VPIPARQVAPRLVRNQEPWSQDRAEPLDFRFLQADSRTRGRKRKAMPWMQGQAMPAPTELPLMVPPSRSFLICSAASMTAESESDLEDHCATRLEELDVLVPIWRSAHIRRRPGANLDGDGQTSGAYELLWIEGRSIELGL